MPTIYRAMKRAADNLPVVEPSARGLGVREPPSSNADVDIDANRMVVLNGKGMSVTRHWRDLPYYRIPKRLNDGTNGATGSNSDCCWKMGGGPFIAAPVAAGLELVLKPHEPNGGNVVPHQAVLLAQFQADLAATRNSWVVDES